jgi:hypothetical protein
MRSFAPSPVTASFLNRAWSPPTATELPVRATAASGGLGNDPGGEDEYHHPDPEPPGPPRAAARAPGNAEAMRGAPLDAEAASGKSRRAWTPPAATALPIG